MRSPPCSKCSRSKRARPCSTRARFDMTLRVTVHSSVRSLADRLPIQRASSRLVNKASNVCEATSSTSAKSRLPRRAANRQTGPQ